MTIHIENRRTSKSVLLNRYAEPIIIDVTSQGAMPYRKMSPFYPHKNIPIPFSEGYHATSVEGIWQGLKVFKNYGIDTSKFYIDNMKGIKRNSRQYGEILGHLRGVEGCDILDYVTAKREIYMPSYAWVIECYLQNEMATIAQMAAQSTVVLLDYNTCENPLDPTKPISHAALCKAYLLGLLTCKK
jgi:hypothetical protein